MPHPCPHHCPPERGGVAVLAVLAVIAAAVLARPVVHAAETVLEVAAITAGAVLGVAAAGAVVWAVVAARRRRGRPYPLAGRPVRSLPAAGVRPIEPPRPVYGTLDEHPGRTEMDSCRADNEHC